MKKQNDLNRWMWKWHVIAGLITTPFMILLAVTGIIYMFRADYEAAIYKHISHVEPVGHQLSLSQQFVSAQDFSNKPITSMVLSDSENAATQFVSGSMGKKQTVYVNPYTGLVTGQINVADTFMVEIRKLHRDLLMGKVGAYTVELVASWFIVLILTGLYVWWPSVWKHGKKGSARGIFWIRRNKGRRIFYRDLHAVFGFWLSAFMLVILAGAMPWTDVFGSNLRWVQKQTDTGYPATWRSPRGLGSKAFEGSEALSIDEIAKVAKKQVLKGKVSVVFPEKPGSVFTVKNRAFLLRDQKVLYFDQYSGSLIKGHDWGDVGFLMDARHIFLRLHEGDYGPVNWWILLIVSSLFAITTTAGLVSYLIRKPAKRWGVPTVPKNWHVDRIVIFGSGVLGILFPMFGLSLLLLWVWGVVRHKFRFRRAIALGNGYS